MKRSDPTIARNGLTMRRDDLTTTHADLTTAHDDPATTRADLTTTHGDLTTTHGDLTTPCADPATTRADLTTRGDPATPCADPAATQAGPTTARKDLAMRRADPITACADPTATCADLTATHAGSTRVCGDLTTTRGDRAATPADLTTPDRGLVRGTFIAAALLFLSLAGLAQRSRFQREEGQRPPFPADGEFHFVRVEYTDLPEYHRGFGYASRDGRGDGWWVVDWPDAEDHFSLGVQRLTRIDTGEPRHFRLTDDRLFDHPWIYATQVGWWGLNGAETARLREYLLRGGFLVVDDFWGAEQWEVFRRTMERVLPEEPITDIDEADSVMHVLYDIREKDRTFIPGTRHLRRGPGGGIVVQQPPGTEPRWRAMYDGRKHMVVAVNFNTDVGDAWEYADAPEYPEAMTTLAYHYGINYLIYSMTH